VKSVSDDLYSIYGNSSYGSNYVPYYDSIKFDSRADIFSYSKVKRLFLWK